MSIAEAVSTGTFFYSMEKYVKDEKYDPGVNLSDEDDTLNNTVSYCSDSGESDGDCVRIVNNTGWLQAATASTMQHSGGPQAGTTCDKCEEQDVCPFKPFTCDHVLCEEKCYDRSAKKCPMSDCNGVKQQSRSGQKTGKCDAVFTENNPKHETGDQVKLYKPGNYLCGLTRITSKGYLFCKYCSECSCCPICGQDRDDSL